MRKFFAIAMIALLTVVLLPAAMAQAPNPAPAVYAEDFNNWTFVSSAANTYVSNAWNCWNTPLERGVPSYFVFGNSNTSTYYPTLIRDANPLLSEIVTPSSISTAQSACGFSAATTNSHTSFWVLSGTAGLQDAVAALSSSGVGAPLEVVYLDKYWYGLVAGLPSTPSVQTAQGIIGALKSGAGVEIVDTTTAPWTYYSWNPTTSAFVISATNATAPTVAAGTGAGGSPTIAVVAGSTGTRGFVTLTTGTSPVASATIFTLTWPAVASGGFAYAPSCSIVSVGTRSYTGTNASVVGPPAVDTYTATATALTASVSGYKWAYTCN